MGGKALRQKGIETVRLNSKDYEMIAARVESEFRLLGWDTHVVKSYRSKETHGDLDILLKNEHRGLDNSLRDDIVKTFRPKAIVKNGNVTSFEFENFQIDAIVVPSYEWETSICFFDYDPTGNIMGKVAHKFGLKYGFNGLVYPYRSETSHHIRDILISNSNIEIFDFLDYNYGRYLLGFNTLEDIFIYLTDSKYFDSSIFQFENLNHIDKKRNRKRKTYNQFLEYINTDEHTHKSIEWKDRLLYLTHIDRFFPKANFLDQYFELKSEEKRYAIIRSKFNGNMIMGMFPDITGMELGKFIEQFKKQFSLFEEYVIDTDEKIIKEALFRFYKKYKENE